MSLAFELQRHGERDPDGIDPNTASNGTAANGVGPSPADPGAGPVATSVSHATDTVAGSSRRSPGPSVRLHRAVRGGTVVNVLAVIVLAAAFLAAVWPGLLTSVDPLTGDPADRLLPPGAEHLFGTDQLGRDLLARTIHGSAQTLWASLSAVGIGVTAGVVIGLVSGFFTGPADAVLMRIVDVLQAVPGLLVSMAVITALGFGTVNVAFAVGVAAIPSFARLTRGEVIRWRSAEFVRAARSDGLSSLAVLGRHVLPQARGPVASLIALEFGSAVLAVSALSFLGFGAPPPQPEWGLLVSEGRDFLASAWWLTTLPGLVVAAVVLAASRLSHVLNSEREFR